VESLHSARQTGNIFRAHVVCHLVTALAGQSRVAWFLLLVLTLRTPLRAQDKEMISNQTIHVYADFVDDHNPAASSPEFHFGSSPRRAGYSGEIGLAAEPRPSSNLLKTCARAPVCDELFSVQAGGVEMRPPAGEDKHGAESEPVPLVSVKKVKLPDRNLDIYYRNRREFSLDVGWHPVNIPFVYDFAVGDSYNMTPLKYTLVPIIASLRWHVTNVGWRWIFRGNMDFTFSGSITPIPRGPETHYYSLDFGIRRNFVYRNWKAVPFFEQRGGAGLINAKEPLGVFWAQGQNLTFTYDMGAGVRYNINSKYSFSAGMNYMHISNGYLSQPAFYNYGINVYGPMFGLDIRLGKPHHSASQ